MTSTGAILVPMLQSLELPAMRSHVGASLLADMLEARAANSNTATIQSLDVMFGVVDLYPEVKNPIKTNHPMEWMLFCSCLRRVAHATGMAISLVLNSEFYRDY
jgi:hypothetical protein